MSGAALVESGMHVDPGVGGHVGGQNSPLKTLGRVVVITDKRDLIFYSNQRHISRITTSQNSPLKTLGRIVVITDKRDLIFYSNQRHISRITTSQVRGNFCPISMG
eukprot:CCRYP_010151-RA/>CCRYP_010151-RA protein AED:0.49 eAED:0.78 QI:0/0/0/0.66/0/0/3/0/105